MGDIRYNDQPLTDPERVALTAQGCNEAFDDMMNGSGLLDELNKDFNKFLKYLAQSIN